MQTAILVVTYSKDIPWLNYCLRSIRKFASGFHEVVLVVPYQESELFRDITGVRVVTYPRNSDPQKWHLDHQRMKCHADSICATSDFVLHTDSDCIFTEQVTPKDYIHDGKPVLLVESFKRIGSSNWKATTDRALWIDSKWETMRRHPAVHYRELYAKARSMVAERNGKSFDQYVLSCKPDFPWGFSEFNVLGNVVMENPNWKHRYKIIDIGVEPRPHDKLLQFWSHWGIDGKITDSGPHFGMRPMDIMEGILA